MEPVRQKTKRAKSRAAEEESPLDPLKVRQLTQKSFLRMGKDEMLCEKYGLQLSILHSCEPLPDLKSLCPFLDELFKGNTNIVKVDDCLKAFHHLSSNAEVMNNLQKNLCNTASDFVAWFLFTFMHVVAEEFSEKAQSDVFCEQLPKVISEEEKDVIFYIAGSVISKLLKRMNRLLHSVKETKNAVADKIHEDISRLNRLVDHCSTVTSNKTLTETLNRGGLKFPKKPVFSIFCHTEQVFCSKVGELSSKIDIAQILEDCVNDEETKKNFFEAIEENSKESISLLRACVALYLKIRTHSHAKNIAEMYRKKTQTLKRKKGIRSELKAKDDK